MSNQLLAASQGINFADVVTAVPGTYAGTEPLSAVVWAGGDQSPLATPTATWLDADAGTITVAIPAATLGGIDPARYRMLIKLADNSAELWDGFLEVDAAPGSAAAPKDYHSYQDMLDRAPWLPKLQRPEDLAGFARQRSLAREWFEDLLHRHYRNGAGMLQDYQFVPGISFGGAYGPGLLWRDGRRSSELQGWLDADRLDVTEPVKDACACYAIALLCDRQLDPTKDDTGYGQAARKFFARAENAATNITAEIDSDGDGTNDTSIRLGVHDTLEG